MPTDADLTARSPCQRLLNTLHYPRHRRACHDWMCEIMAQLPCYLPKPVLRETLKQRERRQRAAALRLDPEIPWRCDPIVHWTQR